MSKKQKLLFFALLAMVATVLGRLFLNSPIAHIQFAAETIGHNIFGKWNITNSIIAAWGAMGILIVFAYFATRKMEMVPRGIQNFAEAVLSWLLGIAENVSGKHKGRVFFPLIATLFLFIIVANWTSLIPVFGNIGKVETGEEFVKHNLESVIDDYNGDHAGANLSVDSYGPGKPPPADVVSAFDSKYGKKGLTIFNGDENGGRPKVIPVGYNVVKELRVREYVDYTTWQPKKETTSSGEPVNLEGKTVGVLVPYLRSMNTDLMNPLAMALIAMFMVEYWGIKFNGFGSYISRFINFKGGPIGFIVGILESVSEIARVISFSFRLLGNMFAGEVLVFAFVFMLPIMAGVFILPFFLETFVGFIQALIFAALTLIFATLATESHEGHKEEGGSSHG